jgi:hypothetical protein
VGHVTIQSRQIVFDERSCCAARSGHHIGVHSDSFLNIKTTNFCLSLPVFEKTPKKCLLYKIPHAGI